jgi:sulfonate transport system ATP-binding protein
VALADRVILIEDGRIALDERVNIARPRERSDPLFGQIEKKILDRVLQQPGEAGSSTEPAWPGTPAHGLRWAV